MGKEEGGWGIFGAHIGGWGNWPGRPVVGAGDFLSADDDGEAKGDCPNRWRGEGGRAALASCPRRWVSGRGRDSACAGMTGGRPPIGRNRRCIGTGLRGGSGWVERCVGCVISRTVVAAEGWGWCVQARNLRLLRCATAGERKSAGELDQSQRYWLWRLRGRSMSRLIDEDIEIFSERYSGLSAQSNKLWAASALLLFTVMTSDFSNDTAQVFGVTARSDLFYFSAAVIAVFLNFAYCSSHIVNLDAGKMYWGLVRSKGLHEREICCLPSGRKYTAENMAHFLYQSNYNRSFPIENALGVSGIGRPFKVTVDVVYSTVPISSFFTSMYKAGVLSMSPIFALAIIGCAAAFVVLPWLALMRVIFGWSEVRS